MKRQTGATLSGLMFFLILLGLVLYTGTRIVPAYMDYWLVDRTLENLVLQPSIQNGGDEHIREQFDKELKLNNVTLASRSDLLIERIPGGLHLSAAMAVKRPYFGPVHLCLEFLAEASAGNTAGH
jgi:hypothetical protein